MKLVEISYHNYHDPTAALIDPALVQATGSAYPTGRRLDGSSDQGFDHEWAEPARLPDGRRCSKMYFFTNAELLDDEGAPLEVANFPWDDTHVRRIKLTDDVVAVAMAHNWFADSRPPVVLQRTHSTRTASASSGKLSGNMRLFAPLFAQAV
jgi:hypothetical protein